MKRIKKNIRHLFYYFANKVNKNKFVFVRAKVNKQSEKVEHFNWGDDINEVFIHFFTNKKIVYLSNCKIEKSFPIVCHMVIGSILTMYNLDNTIIWGAGIINDNEVKNIQGIPKKILAVRGPRTQKELIKRGIECPSVYGDPALLFPRFYQAEMTRKYKMGIIPHYIDMENRNTIRLAREKQVKLIKVQGYCKWTDFIDEICSCEFVVSSSLHGLIIAEAYGIPAVWVEIGKYVDGWEFKFYDFYESIGKLEMKPVLINDLTTVEDMVIQSQKWEKGNIDLERLLDMCPFA